MTLRVPKFRLRRKTKLAKRPQKPTLRKAALKEAVVPKARRPFALYLAANSKAKRGDSKEVHVAEMRRVAADWRAATASVRDKYFKQSEQETCQQHAALASVGIAVRQQGKRRPVVAPPSPSPPSSFSPSRSSTSPSPAFLGHYDIDSVPLGSGSFGVVRKAFTQHGQPCAIKVFRDRTAHRDCVRETELYDNLESIKNVQDRNLFPRLFDVARDAVPSPYAVFELGGLCMADLLSSCPQTFRGKVWSFASQLRRGLRVLHSEARLVHLDIKPMNILWMPTSGQLQICDLGTCERWPCQRAEFEAYCTPGYRPPELWGAAAEGFHRLLQPAVDIFAFGLVVYQAITANMMLFPIDSRHTREGLRHSCLCWAQLWHELRQEKLKAGSVKQHRLEFNLFRSRLLCAGPAEVQATFFCACHPLQESRRWPNLEVLKKL